MKQPLLFRRLLSKTLMPCLRFTFLLGFCVILKHSHTKTRIFSSSCLPTTLSPPSFFDKLTHLIFQSVIFFIAILVAIQCLIYHLVLERGILSQCHFGPPVIKMDSLDFSKPVARVRWTTEQREFLCCLFKFFKKDMRAFGEIFSAAFQLDLQECGFVNGTPSATLHTQWVDMKQGGDITWGKVHMSPFKKDGTWSPVIQRIKGIATSLGVYIYDKDKDDIDTSKFRPSTPKNYSSRLDSAELTATSSTTRTEDIVGPQPQQTVVQTPTSETLETGQRVCYWCWLEGIQSGNLEEPDLSEWSPPTEDHLPPLLYRWSNIDLQGINSKNVFVAGLFSESDAEYFSPEDITQDAFNKYFFNHVSIEPVKSPFISTFKSMLAPTHRATWNGEGAIISIFETNKIQNRIFSAEYLVRKNEVRVRTYKGYGEFLVWGEIPSSAIVCSFKISTLVEIAKQDQEIRGLLQLHVISSYRVNQWPLKKALSKGPGAMDYPSGVIIGKLMNLLKVPKDHCKAVGEGMLYSWQFKRTGSLEAFLTGVEVGYNDPSASASSLILPSTPIVINEAEQQENSHSQPNDSSQESDDELAMSDGNDDTSDDENDSITIDTPCPTRANREIPITLRPVVEIFNRNTGRWSIARESRNISSSEADRSLPPSPTGFSGILTDSEEDIGDSMMEDHDLGVFSEDTGFFEQGNEVTPRDQFATDRARVNSFLNQVRAGSRVSR